MKRWLLSVLVLGVCLGAVSQARACDGAAVGVAPPACVVPGVGVGVGSVAIAPQVFVSPAVSVTPVVAVAPSVAFASSVAVVPGVVTAQAVAFRARPLGVRVRVARRCVGPILPRRVLF